jgi:hypothetical protein
LSAFDSGCSRGFVVVSAPWEQYIEVFGKLTLGNFEGVLSTNQAEFPSMVLWADHAIVAKFSTPVALAWGEFLGLAAGATSKRTFRYSRRLLSKLRRRMNTASKLGPYTQTGRGMCPGVGL